MFGAVSGAHFNPVVTLVDRLVRVDSSTRDSVCYVAAQTVGGCLGAIVANLMFELPAVEWSTKHAIVGRALAVGGRRNRRAAARDPRLRPHGRSAAVPFAVGVWIGGAYWFTSSTSFANPAVTIARTMSDSFAGIKPSSAPMFIVMQLLGASSHSS